VTPIEELVRQALAETPAAVTTTDPLASLDRRVRRARRWLAAGAGAVTAAVVAAVVVPLVVLGGSGSPNGVGIAHHTPTPSPSASSLPGVTQWWPSGAVDLAGSRYGYGGPAWVLVNSNGQPFIAAVGPNGLNDRIHVPEPADFVAPAQAVEWVAGTDSNSDVVRVSGIRNGIGNVDTLTFHGGLEGRPVVVGEALYIVSSDSSGTSVRRFVLSNDGIDQSKPLPIAGATELAVTDKTHPWVLAREKLIEVVTDQNSLSIGPTVDWSGDIYGPMDAASTGDSMWAYDGSRVIGLTPAYLTGCVSCAEGYRVSVAGQPVAVASAFDGGLYVAVSQASTDGKRAGIHTGLAYYPADDVKGAGDAPTDTLFGIQVSSLVEDGHGGVDYVDDQGSLNHWDPPSAAFTR
jgi:hypothetical protein